MSDKNSEEKIVWTTVKIPRSLHVTIKEMAKEEGIAYHKLLSKALAIYRAQKESVRKRQSSEEIRVRGNTFPRGFYYATKIFLAYGDFRAYLKILEQFSELLEKDKDLYIKAISGLNHVLDQVVRRTKVITVKEKNDIMKIAWGIVEKSQKKYNYGEDLKNLNDKIREVAFRLISLE